MSSRPSLILIRALRTPTARVQVRLLATKPPPAPLDPHPFLSQLNNPRPSSSGSRLAGDPHVGPFPLPPGSSERDAGIRAAERSWRQLGTGQKVGRAATQTSSLLVVLAGGCLAAAVLYSTGTELWATNSPTRIFEDCVERVKSSEELSTLLLPPLTFHGSNSSNRLRRNRRISSTLTTDPIDGSETLLVRFWVEGTPLPDPDAEETWFDVVKKWVGPAIWEDSTKPGSYVPRPSVPKLEPAVVVQPERGWGGWVVDGLTSVFAGILPRRKGPNGEIEGPSSGMFKRARKPRLGEYSTGEVVAELKKDPTTNVFVYRQLFVDIPDARSPDHYRVNIPTANVSEPTQGLDRLRFWNRTRPAVA